MKYAVLLRGINVGGKNKVDMKQLVAALETDGFTNVSYYLNTGNIFLESTREEKDIATSVGNAIQKVSGLNIPVLLRSKSNIDSVVNRIPSDWKNTPETKCNVMFLWEQYNDQSVLDLLNIRPGVDEVYYESGAVLWKTSQKDFNKSGMSKLFGTDLYKHMTIRNCNTVRELHKRLG